MLQTREFAVKDIAALFGIPGILAGIEDGTSGWGTGVEQITKNFMRGALGSHIRRFNSELTRKLAPKGKRIEVYLDTTDLLRPTSKEQADWIKTLLGIGISDGVISPNEAREILKMAPNKDPRYDIIKQVTQIGNVEPLPPVSYTHLTLPTTPYV